MHIGPHSPLANVPRNGYPSVQVLRGRLNKPSLSPAAAWFVEALQRCSAQALKRSKTPLLERSDRSPALKERSAEGETHGVMNDCVRPT